MCELNCVVASTQRNLLRFVREHDRRRAWEKDGCRNMGQWLSGRFGISVAAGMRWTHAAHALEHLPLTCAAFERGQISLDKVLQLTRFATAGTERELLRYARRTTVSALRKRADLATRPPLEEHNDTHLARYLELRPFNDSGAIYLEGLLPADEGAVVGNGLRRILDQLPEMPPLPQQNEEMTIPGWATAEGEEQVIPAETVMVRDGLPQRMADALVVLASSHIAADPDPDRATVVVSTTLQALQSDERGCELEGSGVIHPEIARRMSCDCRLQFVLRHPNGTAAGIGRADRNIPGYLRRELLHRDGGCTFPGCGTRRFVDGHHIWHWEAGGPTDLDNLVTLCHFHHKLVHEHGWRVALDEHQVARWFRPDGRTYEPAAARAAPALSMTG
ncbi:MAG: HNH endonuclease [Actinomycetota bacterium]|nr:HNH endonuclease [Actinomycetota bacterium]